MLDRTGWRGYDIETVCVERVRRVIAMIRTGSELCAVAVFTRSEGI